MMRFDWNGLKVGDRVVVSEHVPTSTPPAAGTIAFVHKRLKSNDVGVRVDRTPARVLWPTRHEVERVPDGLSNGAPDGES